MHFGSIREANCHLGRLIMIMKIMITTMKLIRRHSILSGYTLEIITDTSQRPKTVQNGQKRPKTAKNGQTLPKMAKNGQKRNMRMIRIHSRLPRYNLYTIPDTLQPVFRHFYCQNGCWSDGKIENPCHIIKNLPKYVGDLRNETNPG
jgi:hypothetical protein